MCHQCQEHNDIEADDIECAPEAAGHGGDNHPLDHGVVGIDDGPVRRAEAK